MAEEQPKMTPLDEEAPFEDNGSSPLENPGSSSSLGMNQRTKKTRLSKTSELYDAANKGYLDETEQQLRELDSQHLGHISNAKVYDLMQNMKQEQSKSLNLKKAVIALSVFSFLLALSNIGTSFAAARLAKDTSMDGFDLTNKDGVRVAVTDKAVVFQVLKEGEEATRSLVRRNLVDITADSISSISKTEAETIYDDYISQGATVNLLHCDGHSTTLAYDIAVASRGQQKSYSYIASRSNLYAYGKVTIVCDQGSDCAVTGLDCNDLCVANGAYWFCGSDASFPACSATEYGVCCANADGSSCNNDSGGATAPSPASSTMDSVSWDANNEATIEFCEDGGYGYRNVGDTGCYPAGVVVRMEPGNDYILTLQNAASVSTNIHTHGLHISGSGNADDPSRHVSPGMCLKYYYNIPSDHMGGTYWMHSHYHGQTQTQVSGGAFGMLIIEENTSLLDNVEAASQDGIQKWLNNELLLVASKVGNTNLGNGQSNLQFNNMIKDEWYRLRVAAVDPNGRSSTLTLPSSCDIHAVAYDGVWRFNAPQTTVSTSFDLTGSSRLDVAIKCTQEGTFNINFGTGSSTVAQLVVGSGTVTAATPFTSSGGTWQPGRPNYLRDVSTEDVDETYSIQMTAAQINGASYYMGVPALRSFDYGTLQQWTISSSGAHPFHLHVYHMQIVDCGNYEVGEYYDTVSTQANECVVRFHIIDLGERITMHCHVLSHEDNGSMAWVDVTGALPWTQSTLNREEVSCAR